MVNSFVRLVPQSLHRRENKISNNLLKIRISSKRIIQNLCIKFTVAGVHEAKLNMTGFAWLKKALD